MGDVSSGMASTVIQVYLKAILESFLHPKPECRLASLKVISIILSQGLVHPAQIVPYLICMATDSQTRISHAADRDLQVSLFFMIILCIGPFFLSFELLYYGYFWNFLFEKY